MVQRAERFRSVPPRPRQNDHERNIKRGRRWRRERKAFLQQNPLCACGCNRLAEEVDHIIPYAEAPHLFWDWSNWQGLTNECHEKKTAAENAQRNSGGKRRFTDSAMEPGWVD